MRSNARLRSSPASRSRKICAKIGRIFCKISGKPARPAHKNCMHSASVRCAHFTTSLRVDRVSIASRAEKAGVQRRDHANLCPTRAKELQIFLKFRRVARTEKRVQSASVRCANCRMSLQLVDELEVRSHPKKRALNVDITQILRQNRAKEL